MVGGQCGVVMCEIFIMQMMVVVGVYGIVGKVDGIGIVLCEFLWDDCIVVCWYDGVCYYVYGFVCVGYVVKGDVCVCCVDYV